MLSEYGDNQYFGKCARCLLSSISNRLAYCPSCDLYLGSVENESALDTANDSEPPIVGHITYSCRFQSLHFTIKGNGPVIVSNIASSTTSAAQEKGVLSNELVSQGGRVDQCELLASKGLTPRLGDVLVSIENDVMLHLDENEVCEKKLVRI